MKTAEFKSEGNYHAFLPDKSLSNFIESYWIFDLVRKPDHEKRELIQPSLSPEVIFKIGCDYENYKIQQNKTEIVNSSIISGIQLQAIASKRRNTSEKVRLIGIKFNPIGLFHILNIPLYEFLNKRIKLSDLPYGILNVIEEQLVNAKSIEEITDVLNNKLCKYFQNCVLDKESANIKEMMNLNSSKKLYTQNHYRLSTYKSLERKFKKYIGITPTKYYNYKRFLNFYNDWLDINNRNYIQLVYDHGYYDQNHLIKEFKSILGQSPNKFKKLKDTTFTENILTATIGTTK